MGILLAVMFLFCHDGFILIVSVFRGCAKKYKKGEPIMIRLFCLIA
jgi:hypothetical protein